MIRRILTRKQGKRLGNSGCNPPVSMQLDTLGSCPREDGVNEPEATPPVGNMADLSNTLQHGTHSSWGV